MSEQDHQSNSGTESDNSNFKKMVSKKAVVQKVPEKQFESLNRMKNLPVVEAAIVQGQNIYSKVKGELL